MRKPDYQMEFEKAHEAGSKRHFQTWFGANQKAVEAAWAANLDPSDPQVKYMLTMAVLRVLDFVDPPSERAREVSHG